MKHPALLLVAACCFSLTGCFAAFDVTYTAPDGTSVHVNTVKQPAPSQK
jgi:hypothetical protein